VILRTVVAGVRLLDHRIDCESAAPSSAARPLPRAAPANTLHTTRSSQAPKQCQDAFGRGEGAKRPCDCWVAISYTGGSACRRRWREYACLVNGSPANHWSISSSSPSPQVGCAHCHHRRGASRSCIETELVTGPWQHAIVRHLFSLSGSRGWPRISTPSPGGWYVSTRGRHEFPNHCCESLLQLGLWW
jgi:hypothetical protein